MIADALIVLVIAATAAMILADTKKSGVVGRTAAATVLTGLGLWILNPFGLGAVVHALVHGVL